MLMQRQLRCLRSLVTGMGLVLGGALLISGTQAAHAQGLGVSEESKVPPRRLWLYFGANVGYAKLSSGIPALELDKSGYGVHIKALLSYYWEDFVVDFGPGYSFNRLKGNSAFAPAGTDIPVRIYTDAAFIELSPRWRAGEHWQLGLSLDWLLGNDTSFSEYASELQKSTFMVGPRINYETSGEDSRWRFGAQAITDLNIGNRNLWLIQADVQYGFPICCSQKEKWVQSKPEPVLQPYVEPAPPLEPVETMTVETVGNIVRIQLPEAVLRFGTGSADLTHRGNLILKKVARDLQQHPDAWSSLVITGHTDQRGSNASNLKLSRLRAASVARSLERLGVPKDKMTTQGKGESVLLDPSNTEAAWRRNRRVEIEVTSVNERSSSELVDGLRSN